MVLRALVALAFMSAAPAAAQPTPPADATTALVLRLEAAAAAGDTSTLLSLAVDPDDAGIRRFADAVAPPPTRLVVKERDRRPLSSASERLLLEVFAEFGSEAAISTWRADVLLDPDAPQTPRIGEMEQLTSVTGLYRLALNPARQFHVRDLTVTGIDLTLHLPSGNAFVAETADGPTAIVLLGRGRMKFAPSDPAERTQVRIFGGDDALNTEFDAVFIRVRPSEFDRVFSAGAFVERAVVPRDFQRATSVFEDYVGETLHLDLTDLSRDRWSLVPGAGDLIVEVRTRRLGSLTYTRSSKDAEDISLFERRRRRNIAVYASPQKLATRGRFYSEDDLAEYDVLRYEVDAAFTPDRLWVEGSVRLRIRTLPYGMASLTLRLADSLVVRSIDSQQYGRLLHLRVVGQNSIIVNFPTSVPPGTDLWLHVTYGGRLEPQPLDSERATVAQQEVREQIYIPVEPHFLYSNRSYWYPQSTVTDYAMARLQISVPDGFDVVATGTPIGSHGPDPDAAGRPRRLFVFEADHPARYLSCVITRLGHVSSRSVFIPPLEHNVAGGPGGPAAPSPPAPEDADIALQVLANPRQVGRARPLVDRTAGILEYYGSLIGDAPYPTFTLAVTESALPGGHSPAYFAMLNQPLPLLPSVWRNDPVAFDGYPSFFLAHEIAHQWWGQAVGGKNYHEQWLSEGFAQYFATLYAAHDRGDDQLAGMFRQMRRWAMDQSSQGPVYLGYRLGHIRNDGRVFRALVYNKGAMVLHMLRRLLGDDVFFAGIREFYGEWKFRKAGTDDLRQTMERVSGRDLTTFFEGWIYGSSVPVLGFRSTLSKAEALVRFEHRGDVIPLPVTVSLVYTDGRTESFIVAVTEQVVERALPLAGIVRSIEVNRDHAAVAEISRQGRSAGPRIRISGVLSPGQGR